MDLCFLQIILLTACLLRLSSGLDDGTGGPDPQKGRDVGVVGVVSEHEKGLRGGAGVEMKRLDELPRDEAQKEVRMLAVKMDTDRDGYISRDELVTWLVKVEKGYEHKEEDDQWKYLDGDNDGFVTFEDVEEIFAEQGHVGHTDEFSTEELREKYKVADADGNGRLNRKEFSQFLHPSNPSMVEWMLEDHLKNYDKDGDGAISLDEYMSVFGGDDLLEDPPEWLENEREEFKRKYDLNKNGKLDRDELRLWLVPDVVKYAEEEADYLLENADTDEDGRLTPEEVAERLDVFLDSEATDYGGTVHDEL